MKNCNLAQVAQDQQAIVVPFPKHGRQAMSKQEGYTPLPNFICDEGYLATISGDAVKCLVFLNRYVEGFHLENKSMSEVLVMKITGIKDKRTIRKNMAELEKYKLVTVEKTRGKSNVYCLSFDDRLPVEVVAQHVPSASNVGTSHATAVVAQHVPATSDMACHSVKEIYLKENTKSEEEGAREKIESSEQQQKINTSQFFVEYKNEDWASCSFKQVTEKYPTAIQDFMKQGQKAFPDLTHEEILFELKKMSTWSVDAYSRTPQKWMVVWLNTFLPQVQERKAGEQRRIAEKQAEKNKPSHLDVNAYFADQIAENKLDPNFVPDHVLGEEFS